MFVMDGSEGSSGGPAPFLAKTYEMVDDLVTNHIVSWSHNGRSFVVWNPPDFARDLLPMYFKHNNFSSFIRQLNTYGFRKIDPEQWEFANEYFIRGQRNLLKNIHRRKPIHSHSGQGNGATQMSDQEKEEYEKEIEKLTRDNRSLQSELESHKHENQAYEFRMKTLRQRLLNIDQKQRELNTRLAQLLQKPELTSSVAQESEVQNKKRRLLVSNYLYDQASKRDRPILTDCDDLNASSVRVINLEVIENLNTCVGFWEKFFQDVASNLLLEDDYEFSVLLREFPLIATEVQTSSRDSNWNIQPNSSPWSHPSPSLSKEISSSPGPSNLAGSPVISTIYTNLEGKAKSLGIDVNFSPGYVDADEPKYKIDAGRPKSAPANGNDDFWQHFLSETPGSADTPEVQSEMREDDCMSRLVNPNESWCNVDSLAKQMGHLTKTENT